MAQSLKILRLETSAHRAIIEPDEDAADVLDYRVYAHVPRWWRKIEQWLRLDFYLAWRAKQIEQQYDLVWAGSENIGLVLSLFNFRRPIIVVAHHPESPWKARFVRATHLSKRWAGAGYMSHEGKQFLIEHLGMPADRLFQAEWAKYLNRAQPAAESADGPIISVGAAKRDYKTLIAAVSKLTGYETEILSSSKFDDHLTQPISLRIPDWIHVTKFVPEAELMRRYQSARFAIVPLKDTTHGGAGINAVLEAGAFGKAVIATRTGGMPTFVKDGETGILVPPNDIQALQAAIKKLWEQPDLAHQMGQAGRCYLEQNFNPETVQANIQAVLTKIASRQVKDRSTADNN